MLKEEGFGTDCSSLLELLLAEKIGLSGHKIMFTSNDTPAQEYQKARELEAVINLDDISHLSFLENHGGLHTMIASNELDPNYFIDTAKMLFDLVVEISRSLDIHFEFINIGGGIGHSLQAGAGAGGYRIYLQGNKTGLPGRDRRERSPSLKVVYGDGPHDYRTLWLPCFQGTAY